LLELASSDWLAAQLPKVAWFAASPVVASLLPLPALRMLPHELTTFGMTTEPYRNAVAIYKLLLQTVRREAHASRAALEAVNYTISHAVCPNAFSTRHCYLTHLD